MPLNKINQSKLSSRIKRMSVLTPTASVNWMSTGGICFQATPRFSLRLLDTIGFISKNKMEFQYFFNYIRTFRLTLVFQRPWLFPVFIDWTKIFQRGSAERPYIKSNLDWHIPKYIKQSHKQAIFLISIPLNTSATSSVVK